MRPLMGDWMVHQSKLQLGGLDGRLVGLDGALVLALGGLVGVQRLL